jgi:hypothetical protein
MAQTFVIKIKDQIGLHKVRVTEPKQLAQVLARYGVPAEQWHVVEELPDQGELALNSIWAT